MGKPREHDGDFWAELLAGEIEAMLCWGKEAEPHARQILAMYRIDLDVAPLFEP